MTESRDDTRDDFPVPVLANQHVRAPSSIPHGDHELLGMPKCQDDGTPSLIQCIHRGMTLRLKPHRLGNRTDERSPNRRENGQF